MWIVCLELIHMKCHALFSLQKGEKIKMSSATVVTGAWSVEREISYLPY